MLKEWSKCRLGDFMAKKGNSLNPKKYPAETFELYSVPNHSIKKPEIVTGKAIGSTKQHIGNGWVLLSRINPHLNRSWVVKSDSILRKIASSEWVMFPNSDAVYPEFLGYFLITQRMRNYMCANVSGVGGSLTRTNKEAIRQYDFPLPPLPEQRAIVTKLEALFYELDEGVASLQRAQDQLKIYRQAVLKKAFEGELTRAWREQQTDLPTADELLAQIQAERERYYQEQLAEWEEAVRVWEAEEKVGKKPRKPKFIDFDSSLIMLHREPNWQTCTLDLVTQSIFDGPFGSKLKTSDYVDEGVRVIRLENISNLQFKEEKTSFVTNEKYEEIARHTVHAGDIIFSSFISTEISVAIVPVSIPLAINKADCFCIRPHDIISRKYLVYFLASRFTYSQLVNIVHGATRPRINTTQLKEVEVPLCSLPEQHQIVQEIESRLSVCDQVEKDIIANLKRAERLRQSILQKAFAGELLTEAELAACRAEPDWEPAEVLLERIKKHKVK